MTWHEWACPACPISSLKNKFVTLIAGSGKRKTPPPSAPCIFRAVFWDATPKAPERKESLLAARQRQRRAKQVAGSQAHLDGVGDRTSTASWGASSARNTCSEATRVVTPGPRRPGSVRPILTGWGYNSSPGREVWGCHDPGQTAFRSLPEQPPGQLWLLRHKLSGGWSKPAAPTRHARLGRGWVSSRDSKVSRGSAPKIPEHTGSARAPARLAERPHRACSWTA